MNDDYAQYRQRAGMRTVKRSMLGFLKAVVGYGVGLWLAEQLHAAGSITASDENLLVVLLGVWLTYRLLLFLATFLYAYWVMTMPPAGELVDEIRDRVRGVVEGRR